jgi:hypothetical protein
MCSVCTADYSKAGSECIDCSDATGYSSVILATVVLLVVVAGSCIAGSFSYETDNHAADAADQLLQGKSGKWWQSLMVRHECTPTAPPSRIMPVKRIVAGH